MPALTVMPGGAVAGVLSFPKPAGIVEAATHNPGTFGISMNSNLTQLDRLLYDWLAESDDRRFESAFRRYYAAASSQVVRYLARRSSLSDLDFEQIAVDALLKFFCRAGRDRRESAHVVQKNLAGIRPLDLGVFHERQVRRWTSEVETFSQTSMSFLVPEDDTEQRWKSDIQALTARIPPLQRQGWHLLDSARTATTDLAKELDTDSRQDGAPADDSEVSPEYLRVRTFALGLRDAARTGTALPWATKSGHPGLVDFVERSWSVADALPLLRVPTNGYLFDIAQSLYLDECKARGRKKRGGAGFTATDITLPHPLASDDENSPDEERATAAWQAAVADIGIDSTGEQIDEDFCERFYAYLRKPLEDAEEAYRQASMRGRAEAERKRLESIAKKNDRLLSVLTMRIEGETQEAIAESLDISRNQVKYIVELVQASYEQFHVADSRTRAR